MGGRRCWIWLDYLSTLKPESEETGCFAGISRYLVGYRRKIVRAHEPGGSTVDVQFIDKGGGTSRFDGTERALYDLPLLVTVA